MADKDIQETASVIQSIMEKLKSMPLPNELEDWNRIILVRVDGPEQICFEWIVKDGQWQIENGQPHKPDLIVFGTEAELVQIFTSVNTLPKIEGRWGIKNVKKFATLRGTIINYLGDDASGFVDKAKKRKAQEYETIGQSVSRVGSWFFLRMVGIVAFVVAAKWASGGGIDDKTLWIAVSILVPTMLAVKIVAEIINYRRYHHSGIVSAKPAVTIGAVVVLSVALALGVFFWPGSPFATQSSSELSPARAALKAGDTAKAVTELEAFIARQPTSVEAHTLLAQAYQKAGRTEDASKEYQAAILLAPDEVAQYILDPNDIEAHFLLGNAFVNAGRPDEAIARYEAVLRLDPKHISANTNLGAALYQKGELEAAVRQLQAALALAPNDPETRYLLGAAYIQQSQLAKAESEFSKALTARPDFAEAYVGLGNVQLLKGELEPAIGSFKKAVAINPNLPEAYLPLGKALAVQGNTVGARDALNAFLKLNPPDERRQEAEQVLSQLGQ